MAPQGDGYSSVDMDARMFSSWSPPVRDPDVRREERTKTQYKDNAVAPTSDERSAWETPSKPQHPGNAWETPTVSSAPVPRRGKDDGRDEVDIAMDVVKSGATHQLVSNVRQELQRMGQRPGQRSQIA